MLISPIEKFERACAEGEKIFIVKNNEYGNTIVETGVIGACTELIGCVARLKKLVLKSGTGGEYADQKALRNALLDAHNYANIGLMMLDDKNYTGVSNE
jgi:hypothetical protein